MSEINLDNNSSIGKIVSKTAPELNEITDNTNTLVLNDEVLETLDINEDIETLNDNDDIDVLESDIDNTNNQINIINKKEIVKPIAPVVSEDIETLDSDNFTDDEKEVKHSMKQYDDFRKDYIVFDNVRKEYKNESVCTIALDDVSFSIDEGELVIFLGHSGAGKSTALNMLGGMDSVTSGRIIVGDKEITNYDFDELTNYRRKDIGFIFQFYNLIPNLSAKENIELSTELSEDAIDANLILERVGLADGIDKFPSQLSGGEQQRVAIARALAKKPKLLLCDEPTGALDYKTGKQILNLIQETCRKNHITTVIITHNQAVTPMGDKIVYFNSGKVVDVKVNKYPVDVEELEW